MERGKISRIEQEKDEHKKPIITEEINRIYDNLVGPTTPEEPEFSLRKLTRSVSKVVRDEEKRNWTNPLDLKDLIELLSEQEKLLILAFGYQVSAIDRRVVQSQSERAYLNQLTLVADIKFEYKLLFEEIFSRRETAKSDILDELQTLLSPNQFSQSSPLVTRAAESLRAVLPTVSTESSHNKSKKELQELIEARYPLVFLRTVEEHRAIKCVVAAHRASILKLNFQESKVIRWSRARGLEECTQFPHSAQYIWEPCSSFNERKEVLDTCSIEQAISFISNQLKERVRKKNRSQYTYIFPDLTTLINSQANSQPLYRLLKELANSIEQESDATGSTTLIIVGAEGSIPSLLRDSVYILDFFLPTANEIYQELLSPNLTQYGLKEEEAKELAKKAVGMPFQSVERVFRLMTVRKLWSTSREERQQLILETKKQEIRKTGILEYYEPTGNGLEAVGGLGGIKRWVQNFQDWFEQDSYPRLRPRAILLEGYPGCGKSFIARAISQEWKIPQINFDVSRLQSKWVGESESNVFQALRLIEASSPSILFMDEIEKAFSGVGGESSGVMTRLFGTVLSWLSDHHYPILFIATSNDTSKLPPELFRAGRFDKIFVVMPPNDKERVEIIQRKLKAYPISPIQDINLKFLVQNTFGFSAAEIEELIKTKVHWSGLKSVDILEDWQKVIAQVKPQFRTKKMQNLLQKYRQLMREGGGYPASESYDDNFINKLIVQTGEKTLE
ncbi:MAG: AAA family ATPase [Symploca sp. SIO2E6]|nr:AAA family ATPase [Symploca sp. SIO2E6]